MTVDKFINTKKLYKAAMKTAREIMTEFPEKNQEQAFREALKYELGWDTYYSFSFDGKPSFDKRFTEAADRRADDLEKAWGEVFPEKRPIDFIAEAYAIEFQLCKEFPERHRGV